MAVNTVNNARVDLQEMMNFLETQTTYHSRNYKEDSENQEIVICKDDYKLIWPWTNEAAVLIAEACNYIKTSAQSGLEAISNPYSGEENPYDSEDILDLTQEQKQTGEYLSLGEMDTLEFNIDQMEGWEPLDYNVTKTQLRAAIIEYVLSKWYETNGINDEMVKHDKNFKFWVNKIKNNSLNMKKTKKVQKPYRLF